MASSSAASSLRISSVEFCDDHHTLLPVLFIALPPGVRPTVPLVASWPSIPILRDSGSGRVAVGRTGRPRGAVSYLINLSQ
jgi:hypothetical protein